MRSLKIIACLLLLIVPAAALADEKTKAQDHIDAAKAAIEAFVRKSNDNKLVTRDIESARAAMRRGEEAFAGNRTMFGLGDISAETAGSVKHLTDLVDMHLTLGQTRLDTAKAAEELKLLSGQVAKIRAKVKVFEDRKAELERLRASLVKYEALVKELEALKSENAQFVQKEAKLIDAQKTLTVELDFLKTELAKRPPAPPVPQALPAPEAPAPPAKP